MVIANIVGGRGVPRADDPIWLHLDGWAAELGLTAPTAVARVSQPQQNAMPGHAKSRRRRNSAALNPRGSEGRQLGAPSRHRSVI
jgi:hypothetical protein